MIITQQQEYFVIARREECYRYESFIKKASVHIIAYKGTPRRSLKKCERKLG